VLWQAKGSATQCGKIYVQVLRVVSIRSKALHNPYHYAYVTDSGTTGRCSREAW
jgi:hypothetical protein